MNPQEIVVTKFQERFGETPAYIIRAPGRVNLLGEHVDYNDGFVMPIAIDRATWLAFSPSDTDQTMLVAFDLSEEISFMPETLQAKTDAAGKPMPTWALYPAGVMWALREAGLATPALKGIYSSNVPQGSGLSSSASVEMVFVLAWQTLGGWQRSPMERALLGQKAENQYVGVNSGIMDQSWTSSPALVGRKTACCISTAAPWNGIPCPCQMMWQSSSRIRRCAAS
jgi:galactokinase